MHNNQQSKNCWLMGASDGIGLELAKLLYAKGYNIIISARNQQKLDNIVAQLNNGQNKIISLPCDISCNSQLKSAQEVVYSHFATLDLAIFASAVYQPTTLNDLQNNDFANVININLIGFIAFFEAVAQKMIQQQRGHIAVIASVAGYVGLPKSYAYGASKAGIINFCEGVYAELKTNNIDLSLINPGFVATRLTAKNNFYMPNIIMPAKAAELIYQGLQAKKFEISFPKKFIITMKIIRIMPYKILLAILRLIK
jgi:short-subunit dehydrogenase